MAYCQRDSERPAGHLPQSHVEVETTSLAVGEVQSGWQASAPATRRDVASAVGGHPVGAGVTVNSRGSRRQYGHSPSAAATHETAGSLRWLARAAPLTARLVASSSPAASPPAWA